MDFSLKQPRYTGVQFDGTNTQQIRDLLFTYWNPDIIVEEEAADGTLIFRVKDSTMGWRIPKQYWVVMGPLDPSTNVGGGPDIMDQSGLDSRFDPA